ncbi:MAG TPA: c-type cytochrome, partial [Candidatus Acidoferrum sp.]|nr:c-type cytochrome [Candidatus Acidoferrum sp.]
NREPARDPRRRHEHRREVDARHTASLLDSPDRGRPAEGRDRRPMIVGEAGWLRGSALVAVIGVAVAGWLILGLGWNPVAGASAPGRVGQTGQVAQAADGRAVYLQSCAACHGPQGQGTTDGPSLQASGPAAVDFMLRTGRMPLNRPGDPTQRRQPAFDDATIRALVAYAGSFGPGPTIPTVVLSGADISRGRELYTANCAACHGPTGGGDAIGGGVSAPALGQSDPTTVGEAVRVGPGAMPVFGAGLSDRDVNDIATYLQYLETSRPPGGIQPPLVGPVAEGFVAVVIGVGLLIVIVRWIEPPGGRRRARRRTP